jgi:hypothetical protein
MQEFTFASSGGPGFIAVAALLFASLAGVGLWRARHPDNTADANGIYAAGAFFLALAAAGIWFAYRDILSVAAGEGRVELRYLWPRPAAVIDGRDVARIDSVMHSSGKSWHLEMETKSGDKYETSGADRELSDAAAALIRAQGTR